MSIAEHILPYATKSPYAEIVNSAHNGGYAHVNHIEGNSGADKGDALKALGTIHYCFQTHNPSVELHQIPREITKALNKLAPTKEEIRTDVVWVGHGPLGERAGGIPKLGRENQYQGWHGMTDNDGELTLMGNLPPDALRTAIEIGIQTGKDHDIKRRNFSDWLTKIESTDWKTPTWNIGQTFLNQYIAVDYTYWRSSKYPGYDFHYINGKDPINEFLTTYGDTYSNVFGLRFLVAFIKKDGSLDQRIWQPIKPEKQPKEHYISLTRPKETCSLPWIVPETIRIALDTVRYSAISNKVATINPEQTSLIRKSLVKHTTKVRALKGQKWLVSNLDAKLNTAIHRAKLFDQDWGPKKLAEELIGVGWFDAIQEP